MARSNVRWVEWLVGCSLALILLTSYRLQGVVGAGEVMLGLYTAVAGAVWAGRVAATGRVLRLPSISICFTLYAIMVMLPLTFIASQYGISGSSMRDFLAYGLSFTFLFALGAHGSRWESIAIAFCSCLVFIVLYQFAFGGTSAWYSVRFTAGAANPNQLALYLAAAAMLVTLICSSRVLVAAFLLFALFFGVKARSDAFLALVVVSAAIWALSVIVPRRRFLALAAPLCGVLTVGAIWGSEWIFSFLGEQWEEADEGGARVALYVNGLRAWLSTPASFLIGNGAGSFSGLTGPFQFDEAHSTPIDILSIGGVLGLALFYYFPLKAILIFYNREQKVIFAVACGLMAFSLFHFVGRHPIYWFTVYCMVMASESSGRGFVGKTKDRILAVGGGS